MKEFYPGIPKLKYEGPDSKNPLSFKFYNPDEMIAGKKMKDHLRYAMSYWHTMCGTGSDMFSSMGSTDRTYGKESDPMETARNKAYAAFEFLDKTGIDYFCFHDRDIAPEGDTLKETNKRLDEISKLIKGLMNDTGKKLLWGTASLFGHKRYVHGAATSPQADVFAYAAAQVKKAMEITVDLGGQGYVFWGGREGYETLLNTDMGLELDNLARFLHMAVDYAKEIKFDGYFYIEPKPKEPTKHQYDFDVGNVVAFMRKNGLEKIFKFNIEANHATLAMHTFQHELQLARVHGMFGSIDANRGDYLLGWDTDQFPTDVYDTTFAMSEVIKAGGFTKGGLNFDAKIRRGSFTNEDLFHAYISGMDGFALGLKMAYKLHDAGELDQFIANRYASYNSGIGKDIVSGKVGFKELEQYALGLEGIQVESGRQEMLESIVNRSLFGK